MENFNECIDLEDYVPKKIIRNGGRFLLRNEIVNNYNILNDNTIEIFGRLFTFNKGYETKVHIENGLIISKYCSSCGDTICEHVVATLLKASIKKRIQISKIHNIDDIYSYNIWRNYDDYSPNFSNNIKEIKESFNKFENIVVENAEASKVALEVSYPFYIFHIKDDELCIQFAISQKKKTAPNQYKKPQSIVINKLLTSSNIIIPNEEKEIVKDIAILGKDNKKYDTYYSRYDLLNFDSIANASTIIEKLLNTNRCKFQNNSKLYDVVLDNDKEGELVWEINNEDTTQIPSVKVGDLKDCKLLFVDNVLYVYKDASSIYHMGRVITKYSTKEVENWLKLPILKNEFSKQTIKLIKDNEKLNKFPLPKYFKTVYDNIDSLTPIITFLTKSIEPKRYSVMKNKKPVPFSYITLDFSYNNKIIPSDYVKDTISYVEGSNVHVIKRDRVKEIQFKKELYGYGLFKLTDDDAFDADGDYDLFEFQKVLEHNIFLLSEFRINSIEYSEQQFEDLKTKLQSDLTKKGWIVKNECIRTILATQIDNWYCNLEETSNDWFDVNLGVVVKDKRVNIVPHLINLLKTTNDISLNRILNSDDKILIKIDDNNQIEIQNSKIRNLLMIINSINESKNKKQLSCSKLKVEEIYHLLKQDSWNVEAKDNLIKFSNSLRNFNGIKQVKIPRTINAKLRDYQIQGVSWLQFLREYNLNGILADDMGLGKTLQVISNIEIERQEGRLDNPVLIVCPTSVVSNWTNQISTYAPKLTYQKILGANRKESLNNISKFNINIISYALLRIDSEDIIKHQYHYLILDESQYIKNSTTQSNKTACEINAKHKICLTGTPMENNLNEIWSQFNFLMPELLGSNAFFKKYFRNPIEKNSDANSKEILLNRLKPFVLRRTKDLVAKELPQKTEIVQEITLDEKQSDLYEGIRISMLKEVRSEIEKKGLEKSHIMVLDALLKLRQVCCDPRLLPLDKKFIECNESAKLAALMELLTGLISEGRKILLFSQFTSMLEIIEKELNKQKIKYQVLTGKTKDRETLIDNFQNKDIPLFLLSLKAGGTGLNLSKADVVIHYDPWWNPAVEEQATDRAHRIGQQKPVFVYKFIVKNSVEEKINKLQKKKKALFDAILDSKKLTRNSLTVEDIEGLFTPLAS